MTELTQQERESILNYYDSTRDDKSKMNMEIRNLIKMIFSMNIKYSDYDCFFKYLCRIYN